MSLKSVLPFDYFTLTTRLSIAVVRTKISDSIEPRRRFRYLFEIEGICPYEGKMEDDRFEVTRIQPTSSNPFYNDRWNRYLPVIKGRIQPDAGATQIIVRIRPDAMVLVFMSILLCVFLMVCIALFTNMKVYVDPFLPGDGFGMLWLPSCIFMFIYLIFLLEYKTEAKNAKHFFAELLKSHE